MQAKEEKYLVCREIFICKCIELLVDIAIDRYIEINEWTVLMADIQKGIA